MTALGELSRVSFAYGVRDVITDVSLSITRGQIAGVIGPNASGKSTLARLLCGLLAPRFGEALLGGTNAHALPRREAARRAALVSQLIPTELPFTSREVVLMGRAPHLGLLALESAEDVRLADAALAEVRISHLAERAFDTLSGGEKQLCILARAIAQAAPLVVLDEPTSALDLAHQTDLARALKSHAARGGGALVVVHDLSFAGAVCDHLTLLSRGSVVASGAPHDVLAPAPLAAAYETSVRVIADPKTGAPIVLPSLDEKL